MVELSQLAVPGVHPSTDHPCNSSRIGRLCSEFTVLLSESYKHVNLSMVVSIYTIEKVNFLISPTTSRIVHGILKCLCASTVRSIVIFKKLATYFVTCCTNFFSYFVCSIYSRCYHPWILTASTISSANEMSETSIKLYTEKCIFRLI